MLRISVVLSFIVIFISCNHPVTNSPDGTESNLTILTYGFSGSSQAQSVTAKKYGFQFRSIAGCIVEQELVDSVHLHNKFVYSILEKKHGKNWKQKFNKDVEATYLITSRVEELVKKQDYIIEQQTKSEKEGNRLWFAVEETGQDSIYNVQACGWRIGKGKLEYVVYYKMMANLVNRHVVQTSNKVEKL